MELQDIINSCETKTEAIKKIYGYHNSKSSKKFIELVEENNLDISLLTSKSPKHKRFYRNCPVCDTKFITNEKENKITCSYSCSNSYFRSGINNPNWKMDTYRSTCFAYHKKECVVCGEDKIVAVHHFDENRNNNSPENLIPLCPTHHQYVHSKYKGEVIGKIEEYRKQFLNECVV